MVKIIFIKNNKRTEIEANVGASLLEAANNSGVELFGGCGGAGVCGTCHVYIDERFIKFLPEPENSELDILDIVSNSKENSRLACQVFIQENLYGMEVTIP